MDGRMHSISTINQEEAKQYIGGVAFVSIIMIFGFVGNLHVILVYAFRIKPSNHRIFILVLGTLDFITCIVGMPFIIVDLRNPLTFTMSSACKILRFINYFICLSSALTLIVIATDRYRKICVPFGRQISRKMAKLLCLLVIFTSLCISWPAPVLFGIVSVKTSDPHINGTRCCTEDSENFQAYQSIFNGILILIIIICFIFLVVLYTLTWRVIVKQSRLTHQNFVEQPKECLQQGEDINAGIENLSKIGDLSETSSKGDAIRSCSINKEIFMVENNHYLTNCEKENDKGHEIVKPREPQTREKRYSERSRKTTFIFLIITAVFFFSYIPHLILKVISFTKKEFVSNMSFTEKVLYNTFIWCFFVNNMANCFIYGFYDLQFRRELKNVYTELFHLMVRCWVSE